MKIRARNIIIIAIIVVMITGIGITIPMTVGMNSPDKIDREKYSEYKKLSASQVKADVKKLIKNTEATHPYITLKGKSEGYNEAKESLLKMGEATTFELRNEIMKYLATFNDLHTSARVFASADAVAAIKDFSLTLNENKKFALTADLQSEIPVSAVLTKIGGISIETVIEKLSVYCGMENEYGIYFIYGSNLLTYVEFMKSAGCQIENDTIKFEFEYEGALYERVCDVMTLAEYNKIKDDTKAAAGDFKYSGIADTVTEAADAAKPNFEMKMDKDVMNLTIRSCIDDGSYEGVYKEVENKIKEGVKKVVIDMRDNGGGSDGYGVYLLYAMGFRFGNIDHTIKYSWTTRRYRNTVAMSGTSNMPFRYQSKNTNNIQLKVISNVKTFSAAMSLVSSTKYFDLGEVFGQVSAQSPNFCGNITEHQLKNSGIVYVLPISYGYYMKDGEVVGNELIPDISIGAFEDPFDYIAFN